MKNAILLDLEWTMLQETIKRKVVEVFHTKGHEVGIITSPQGFIVESSHKAFTFTARQLAESRKGTTPLDLTAVELAAERAAEGVVGSFKPGMGVAVFPLLWGDAGMSFSFEVILLLCEEQ